MIKIKILKIIVLMLLLNIISVTAAIDASYECKEKNCIEGTEVLFTVNVFNNINKSINVGDVYIKDKNYDVVLGFDVSENIVILPGEVHSFNFTSTIKEPTKGYTFYYVPCFKMSYVSKPEKVFEICGKTVNSLTVIPLSDIECKEDSECENDEYCNTSSIYKCRKVECNINESAVNHSCAVIEPKKIVVINWKNTILTIGAIVLAVVLLFLFIKRKENNDDNYVDMTIGFGEEKHIPKQEKTDKKVNEYKEKQVYEEDKKEKEYKEEKLDNDKNIEESFDKPKKENYEKNEESNYKKEVEGGKKIIKKKVKPDKKKKGNKKKYKHIKKDKTNNTVSEYLLTNENEFKDNIETQDNKVEIKDYSDYEEDDEENKDVFFD